MNNEEFAAAMMVFSWKFRNFAAVITIYLNG